MTTKIEWSDETWNPVTGCDRISPGCDNCLTPDTPVLTLNGEYRPIGDLAVGDVLLAFDDDDALGVGQNRVWREATVLAKWTTVKPTVKLTLADGRQVIASADHKWLAKVRPYWRATKSLRLGSRLVVVPPPVPSPLDEEYAAGYIAGATAGDGTMRWSPDWWSDRLGYPQVYWRVAEPDFDMPILERLRDYLAKFGVIVNVRSFDGGDGGFEPLSGKREPMSKVETRRAEGLAAISQLMQPMEDRWKAGWLAGMVDTDGCHSGGSLRISQRKPNDVLDRCVKYAADLGFDMRRESHNSCPTVRLYGGATEKIRFFSVVTPALGRKALGGITGEQIRVAQGAIEVTGIERGPEMELVDITTSTGTFIANGILTHNCYALTMAGRLRAMGQAKYQNDGDPRTSGPGFAVTCHPDELRRPLTWTKPRMVFVNSMSDLFHEDVSSAFIASVYDVMALHGQHTYQVLTKRPQRMASLMRSLNGGHGTWPLPNVWHIVSVEKDRYCFRVDHLRSTDSAVRGVSLEPLIGALPSLDLTGIDWAIIGAESGKGARPMELDWAREIVEKARRSGTAVFVKQLSGGFHAVKDMDLFPKDLRIREYPKAAA